MTPTNETIKVLRDSIQMATVAAMRAERLATRPDLPATKRPGAYAFVAKDGAK